MTTTPNSTPTPPSSVPPSPLPPAPPLPPFTKLFLGLELSSARAKRRGGGGLEWERERRREGGAGEGREGVQAELISRVWFKAAVQEQQQVKSGSRRQIVCDTTWVGQDTHSAPQWHFNSKKMLGRMWEESLGGGASNRWTSPSLRELPLLWLPFAWTLSRHWICWIGEKMYLRDLIENQVTS